MTTTTCSNQLMTNDVTSVQKHQVYKIKNNRSGKEIRCISGLLWITQQGDGIDRILKAGDIYQSRISNNILVEGLDDSRLEVSSLRNASFIGFHQQQVNTRQLAGA